MVNRRRSRAVLESGYTHHSALDTAGQSQRFRTLRHEAPAVALPAGRLGRCPGGNGHARLCAAVRALFRKEGALKRVARVQRGSLVFNRRFRTWNFLWCENGHRRSRVIGTRREFPTKASAWRAAEPLRHLLEEPVSYRVITVKSLVTQYQNERMPQRHSTRRGYQSWLENYILPHWGERQLTDMQARPVELWLQSLALSPKSKLHIRGILSILWDYAMWRGDVPTERNPMQLAQSLLAMPQLMPRLGIAE